MKFYEKYIELMQDSSSFFGLCGEIGDEEIFKLFIPTKTEKDLHVQSGGGRMFWGRASQQELGMQFGALRQTIILFCAAINNEL